MHSTEKRIWTGQDESSELIEVTMLVSHRSLIGVLRSLMRYEVVVVIVQDLAGWRG